ncbi:MAG TPA: hypothetical protein VL202_01780 [Pararhizobium sp.]|uniref:hypothetical protein n=1 Tax=Pararhizobium sp. TaxID=1977563 RepID=UPI002BC314DF|nr:hypothetical protein [Pararhizobium sp.]HTO29901.1 hypothetical protein [Pararhizobium sp.]
MDDDTVTQLNVIRDQLHARAEELSRLKSDDDTATLMSAMAVTMEAVRSLGQKLDKLDGPQGLGGAGE